MLKGHVFKQQIFGNQIFAVFIDTFLNKKCGVSSAYGDGMKVSFSNENKTLTISKGTACIRGRFIEEDTFTTINTGDIDGYYRLVIEINLDKQNTESEFNQGSYKILKGTNGYPYLTQTDIVKNNTGVYQYLLCQFRIVSSNITNIEDKRTFLDFETIYDVMEREYNSVLQQLEENLQKTKDNSIYVLKDQRLKNENLNDIKTTGFYYSVGGNLITNKPTGVDGFSLIINRGGESPYTQILVSTSQNIGKIYYRVYQSTGNWTEWIELYNSKFNNIVQEQTITVVDDEASKLSLTFKRNMQLVTVEGKWKIKDSNKFNGLGSLEIDIPDFAKISKKSDSRIRLTGEFKIASMSDGIIRDFSLIQIEKYQERYYILGTAEPTVNRSFDIQCIPYLVE